MYDKASEINPLDLEPYINKGRFIDIEYRVISDRLKLI